MCKPKYVTIIIIFQMGGAAGINKPSDDISSVFLDDRLLSGASLMKYCSAARRHFVDYIKNGTWTTSLRQFEEFVHPNLETTQSVWKSFGYRSPLCSVAHHVRSSFQTDSSSDSEKMSARHPNQAMMDECYGAITNCNLFKSVDLRAIVFAALLPMYMSSLEYLESNFALDDLSSTCSIECTSPKKINSKQRSEYLQDWLGGAAAAYDGSALEEYLADPHSNWVEDYLSAISSLPVAITLSAVNPTARESHVVYTNLAKKGFFSQGIIQVATAVFTAKRYKRSLLLSNGDCQLRAIKPIFNAHGEHMYGLGLESHPFSGPALNRSSDSEEPFHQVEGLLALLSMLIKTK